MVAILEIVEVVNTDYWSVAIANPELDLSASNFFIFEVVTLALTIWFILVPAAKDISVEER